MTKSPFVPCQPKIVSIGHTLVLLYPKVNLSMNNAEKAPAFQHNKTALASADLDQRACLLTLANRLNLMLMAKSSLADWQRKLLRNWGNFNHLKILLWHDAKGNSIIDTTNATDLSILKPIQNGKRDNCCSAWVKFVCV